GHVRAGPAAARRRQRDPDPPDRADRIGSFPVSSGTTNHDEMAQAEALPQADASSLVDADLLEAEVKDMYRQVAREEEAGLHFEVGRALASRLGYHEEVLDTIPAEALASVAGAGHHFGLAA